MSVFAPSLINLWKTIETYGVDPEPLFAEEGIKIKLPIDPYLRLPYEKVDRIRAKAVEVCGDEAFGLRSAEVYTPSQLGALGYACLNSLTLRKAVLRIERFIRLINNKAKVRVEDRDQNMVVSIGLNLPSACESARDQAGMALLTQISRVIYGSEFRLQKVEFSHSEPVDLQPYYEFFGCQLSFGQPENRLWIPLSMADETLTGADPELAMLNDQVIMKRLARVEKGDIIARLQAVLMDQLPTGNISDDSVAEALHMSVRTLHRKLADVGTNFRTKLVETRRNLAEQYILDNGLTLTEISLLLGFSEPSSFSRAFKNWTGASPTQARQSLQESDH